MLFRRFCCALSLLLPILAGAQTTPRWIVGGENDEATQLGRIRGFATLPRSFVVLEADAPFIKVFDYSGRLLQSLGRAGSGPGEFRAPSSITYDGRRKRLLVVDAANARVTTYTAGDSLVGARFLTLEDIGIRSICTLGPRLFGLARNAPTIMRELREDATTLHVIASFGEPRTDHPHGTHPLVRTRASDGPLFCDERGSRLVAASSIMGEVHTFDGETRAQRTLRLPDFLRLTITVDNTSMTMAPPATGFDVILGLVEWDGALRAVTERSKPEPGGTPVSLGFATAAIRISGPEKLSVRGLWRPLAQTSAGALCAVSDPAPAIALFTGGKCP